MQQPPSTYPIAAVVRNGKSLELKMVADAECGTSYKLVDGDLGVSPRGLLLWVYAADGSDRKLRFGGDILTELGEPVCVELPGPNGRRGQRMYMLVAPAGDATTSRTISYTLQASTSPTPKSDDDWEDVTMYSAAQNGTGEIKMPPR